MLIKTSDLAKKLHHEHLSRNTIKVFQSFLCINIIHFGLFIYYLLASVIMANVIGCRQARSFKGT